MARYERDYGGIRADTGAPRGMDPNHRETYGGMRMQGSPYQAAYGLYRHHHAGALGDAGRDGYRAGGRYDRGLTYPRGRPERYDSSMRRDGGVHDWREHPERIRHYNANSPLLQGGGRDEDRMSSGRELRRGVRPYEIDARFRHDYGNRGLSSGGFSEPWARGPNPGAR
jgi:hypothetical protein